MKINCRSWELQHGQRIINRRDSSSFNSINIYAEEGTDIHDFRVERGSRDGRIDELHGVDGSHEKEGAGKFQRTASEIE